jgi:hypothetical protein
MIYIDIARTRSKVFIHICELKLATGAKVSLVLQAPYYFKFILFR